MKVRFDMRGYTNLFTNTVAIPDHNRLVVKKVCPFSINRIAHSKQSSLIFCLCTGKSDIDTLQQVECDIMYIQQSIPQITIHLLYRHLTTGGM